jgi:hypothetical protein
MYVDIAVPTYLQVAFLFLTFLRSAVLEEGAVLFLGHPLLNF